MNGMVTGGWGFVTAAYTITVLALIVYGVYLVTSLRDETSGSSRERVTQ